MKTFFIGLLLFAFVALPAVPQESMLPDDIAQFYRDYNFVNTICLSNEKSIVVMKANQRVDPSLIKNERMRKAIGVMEGVLSRIISLDGDMNTMDHPPYPYHMTNSEFYYISRWQKTPEGVVVQLDTYTVGEEVNARHVASYTPDQTPEKYTPLDLSELKFYSKEIHKWILIDGRWYKPQVNIILVD